MSKETMSKKAKSKVDYLVSKEEFESYVQVQKIGAFNMLDPRARAMTELNREQYFHVLKNYGYLKDLYSIS